MTDLQMADSQNKVVIITGASGGIGCATAVGFACQGARLTLTGRNEEKLVETKEKCIQAGLKESQILTVIADVTKDDEVRDIVNKTMERFAQLDVLVNNAGFTINGGFESIEVDCMDAMYQVHVRSVFILSKAALPHLTASKGCIVNVSSISGNRPIPYCFAYSAAKATMDHMTRMLAVDLGPKGIRVNAVSPSITKTDLFIKPGGHMSHAPEKLSEFYEAMARAHPMQKVGEPEDVAQMIVYLASSAASFISGAIIPIDGARNCTVAAPSIKMSSPDT